jgi:hypothetical protein
MADTTKMTLSDIRQEVVRRNKHVDDLKVRLDKLGGELQEILLDIDELEGNAPPRKRRGRRPASAETVETGEEKAPESIGEAEEESESAPSPFSPEIDAPRKRRGRPPKSETVSAGFGGEPDAGDPKAGPVEPVAKKGPSIVDAAVEVLKSWGKPLSPAELAQKIEERGVVSGNTQQVLLMAAGRRSRIAKDENGNIALIPDDGAKPE